MKEWSENPLRALLASNEEDRFTEALAALLSSRDLLTPFLIKFCDVHDGAGKHDLSIHTQVTVPGGRPDLVVRGRDHLLILESKVGSGLSGDQLSVYGERLLEWKDDNPQGTIGLFLITPSAWQGIDLQNGDYAVREGETVPFRLITWQAIADLFDGLQPDLTNHDLAAHTRSFADLIRFRLGDSARPFVRTEVEALRNPTVSDSIRRLKRLLNLIREELDRDPAFQTSYSYGLGYDGYSIKTVDRQWWLGIWYGVWGGEIETPLVLQLKGFETGAPIRPPIEGPNPVKYRTGSQSGFLVPLPIREGVELDQLAREHAGIIRRYFQECWES